MRKSTLIAFGLALGLTAMANTVPFYENFDGDWKENFPTRLDLDSNHPTAQMLTLFLDGDTGAASPWWPLKDSNTSDDRFMSSHARYSPAGTSNDWLGSRAIEIPTEGFNLTFGAQSARYGSDASVSSLWLYITETPVTKDNVPAEATKIFENVPENDPFVVEKDFTTYTVNLDEYAGKTIYIYFVNKNSEKDFLCIDEVKVERLDPTELVSSTTPMIVQGEYTVNSTMTAVEPIGKWTLTFSDGINEDQKVEGESLAAGESLDHVWKAEAPGNTVINYTLTLDVEGMNPVVSTGSVDVLFFEPFHRVLIEEATGLWCGNCPMGMYNMEEIMKDEEMKEYSIPVSIHIAGSGIDYLVNETYAGAFGVLAAPAYRLDRDPVVRYFSTVDDTKFNKNNERSMANAVMRRHRELTTMDIDLNAEYHVVDGDTIQILATAKLRAAKDFNKHNMRIGFIVKENNVHADSPFMLQHNYFSGTKQIDGTMGGWVNLPEVVSNFYFQDVARGIYNYRGMENSVPAELKCGETYEVAYAVPIPDTFYQDRYAGELCIGNPAVQTDFVTLVAFIYDMDTQRIVNSVAFPMSEIASHRVDTAESVGVGSIEADNEYDSNAPVIWYDMQGRRVENPTQGMFIKVQGGKSEKVMLR